MTDRARPNAEECEAAKAKAAYEAWLRNKVAASVSDTRPSITHSEMERRMQQRIQRLKASKAGSPDPGSV
ncbi:hypothetical protein [Stenotrophomonas maltophilia]|uniref:antitoxin PaaA2 family protein n=1 Tax=Stenotrophomonas maltophilia TaxID=40324 RepID=UPI0009B2B1F0